MNPKKIVITGGPATGKTSIIKGLQNKGYRCFHEIIRHLTNEAKENGNLGSLDTNPIDSVLNPLEFNRKLLDGRKEQYLKSEKVDCSLVFFDRGIPDVLAYMDYYNQTLQSEFIETAALHKYEVIFLLPMWKEIFITDEERFESYEDALKIQDCLKRNYMNFGYSIIEVPRDSIENRIEFILKNVK